MIKLIILLLILYLLYTLFQYYRLVYRSISIVDNWIKSVENHDVGKISSYFCDDAVLLGTISRQLRSGIDIRRYFDYFANLPNIRVISRQYEIQRLSYNLSINNALIEWMWDGLDKPIIARISFVIKDNCIINLHSSKLPAINEKLLLISGRD